MKNKAVSLVLASLVLAVSGCAGAQKDTAAADAAAEKTAKCRKVTGRSAASLDCQTVETPAAGTTTEPGAGARRASKVNPKHGENR